MRPKTILLVLQAVLALAVSNVSDATVLGICGSTKGQRYIIPDGNCIFPNGDVRPFACNMPNTKYVNFRSACSAHDRCYSTKGATRSACDTRLYKDMTSACRSALTTTFPEAGRKACFQLAIGYNDKVRELGCPAFKQAQEALGVKNPSCN